MSQTNKMRLDEIRAGFEAKYFIPSHIKYNPDECTYKSRYDGEMFERLAVQTNNMFSIWREACLFVQKTN